MPAAPRPPDEILRLAALRSYAVLDTASEKAFDDLVALAGEFTGFPIATVSLVDADRVWFKARFGLDAAECPRDQAFCAHAILDPARPLSVPDLAEDARFSDNPLVVAQPGIRAYLGVPLVTPEGHALGTFCIMDERPRAQDERLVRTVERLAQAASANLELRRALARVSAAAVTDPLTGLPNRAALLAELESVLGRGEPLAVIAMDLDHFKEANDSHGHAAGDALLRAAAERIRAAVRPGDFVGRLGGDEFVAFLPGVADHAVAAAIAAHIGREVGRPVLHEGRSLRLGTTLGIAMAPHDAEEPGLLSRLADEALMRAKRKQRGSIGRAQPDDARRVAREAALLRALREAGDAAPTGLDAHFQPVLDARTGAVTAVEALARWTHPELGPVPPAEMFSAAARLGRSETLCRQARRRALEAFAALRRDGLAPPRLAVNLSAAELLRGEVAETLEAQVAEAGLDLSCLTLEITEDVLLDRVAHATLDRLSALRGRGARLALDDFGTGTSGLAQLLRIPLDAIKLDGAFTARLLTDPKAARVVEGMIRLAQALGLETIAEAVEEDAQARTLLQLGCDQVQGYLHARPMPAAALSAWLAQRHGAAATSGA